MSKRKTRFMIWFHVVFKRGIDCVIINITNGRKQWNVSSKTTDVIKFVTRFDCMNVLLKLFYLQIKMQVAERIRKFASAELQLPPKVHKVVSKNNTSRLDKYDHEPIWVLFKERGDCILHTRANRKRTVLCCKKCRQFLCKEVCWHKWHYDANL